MFTPQQLSESGFTKAVFGGYDMDSVHDVLDPLTEDYTTLYKENAVLKSKLRILVEKLEEYRQQGKQPAPKAEVTDAEAEDSAKEIIRSAEDKASVLIREAHERAKSILSEANAKAERTARLSAGELELEEDRLNQARQAAASFIQAIQANIDRHQELLDNLKLLELPETPEDETAAAPAKAPEAPKKEQAAEQKAAPKKEQAAEQKAAPEKKAEPKAAEPKAEEPGVPELVPPPYVPEDDPDEIAREIEQNLEKLVGSVPNSTYDASQQDTRVMPPLHPESITAKFGDLQFGKNYNPKQ